MNNDKFRRTLYLKNLKTRTKIKRSLKNKNLNFDERFKLQINLNKKPKNSTKERIKNRCIITGRSKGIVGLFGISRIKVREMISQGRLPGVKKASW
jgi:small subunit ribosomal protein S14